MSLPERGALGCAAVDAGSGVSTDAGAGDGAGAATPPVFPFGAGTAAVAAPVSPPSDSASPPHATSKQANRALFMPDPRATHVPSGKFRRPRPPLGLSL